MIAGIPVLVGDAPDGKRPWPLVLLSHGFTGGKEDWRGRLAELSGAGYLAVAMDNRLHGEREGAGFSSLLTEGTIDLPGLRRVMQETAADMSLLIDHFVSHKAVDGDRIAVVGVSMGGFISFAALVGDSRIKVAAPIIASPYWGDIPGDTPVDLDAEAAADLAGFSGRYEPASRKESIPPRPLLMQIGADDAHYDGARVERFYEELRPLYGEAPDRVRLIVHEGVAHEFTDEMWVNAIAWLEKHL